MLTTPQLATLRAHIDADPVLAAYPNNADGHIEIAKALNAPSAPAFIVWRTSVAMDEIMRNGMDWTRVDNLSVGKARIWEWMFANEGRDFNPSKATIRAGIDAVWVGTQADLNVRTTVYTHCKRTATRAEALFASGTGTDATPGLLAFEGTLDYHDIEEARR